MIPRRERALVYASRLSGWWPGVREFSKDDVDLQRWKPRLIVCMDHTKA